MGWEDSVMQNKKNPLIISVFGAASDAISRSKKKDSYAVGRLLGTLGHTLIYGAGSTGVMGSVVDGYLSTNPPRKPFGSTTTYINLMEKARPQGDIHLIQTRSMSERKEIYWMADICLVMPGGIGTLDELFEFATMAKLGQWSGHIYIWKKGWIADLLKKMFDELEKQKFISGLNDMITWVDFQDLERLL